MQRAKRTLDLYNDAAKQNTGKHRDESATIVLKKFHNKIKSLLYEEFAQGKRILDLASGRGGDLFKYAHANIQKVHAIDASSESILEAQKRLSNIKNDLWVDVCFECVSHFGISPFVSEFGPFDAVSCMFALHYFFESEQMLHTTIRNVALNLKPGGIFFGCVPHGLKILELLRDKSSYTSNVVHIERDPNKRPDCFGSICSFALTDSVTENRSEEFLVFENVLVTVAAVYGLKPILTDFKSHCLNMCTKRGHGVFRHFAPGFEDAEQSIVSRLFCVFAFSKQQD